MNGGFADAEMSSSFGSGVAGIEEATKVSVGEFCAAINLLSLKQT
jgi:hypothetical protein